MAQYRNKPVVIEAMQFRGPAMRSCHAGPLQDDLAYAVAFDDWMVEHVPRNARYKGSTLTIPLGLNTSVVAEPGDWIIVDSDGEVFSCDPESFAANHEVM